MALVAEDGRVIEQRSTKETATLDMGLLQNNAVQELLSPNPHFSYRLRRLSAWDTLEVPRAVDDGVDFDGNDR